MNPLSHVMVNLSLLEEHGIKCDKGQVLVGGIIPDLAILQLFTWKQTHSDSLGFISYLAEKDPGFLPFGFGLLLHGEEPCGLDYYTHSKGGFIDRLEMPVYDIVQRYKPRLYGGRLNLFIHSLIEYSADTLLQRQNADELNKAMEGIDVPRASYHLSNYYKADGKRISRAFKVLRRFDFGRLTEPDEVAKIWRSFQMYQTLGKGSLFQRYSALTQSLTLMKIRPLRRMIHETRELLRVPLAEHLAASKEGIARSLIKPFPDPISPRPASP